MITASIVIPTFNRFESLQRALRSITIQDYPSSLYEVVVVDDGSQDDTPKIRDQAFPFQFTYIAQANLGDAEARNTGAMHSRGDVLFFLDDDTEVSPQFLRHLLAHHTFSDKWIIIGFDKEASGASNLDARKRPEVESIRHGLEEIKFTVVFSNNMSIQRSDYWWVGPMTNLGFKGSSIWCDVEFCYRAHLLGFRFFRCNEALFRHHDYVRADFNVERRRMWEVGYRAAALSERHPDLIQHLEMLHDKGPVLWSDSHNLMLRKLARRLLSSGCSMWIIERMLQRTRVSSQLGPVLSRWIIGAEIFRGFRKGLKRIAPRESKGMEVACF